MILPRVSTRAGTAEEILAALRQAVMVRFQDKGIPVRFESLLRPHWHTTNAHWKESPHSFWKP